MEQRFRMTKKKKPVWKKLFSGGSKASDKKPLRKPAVNTSFSTEYTPSEQDLKDVQDMIDLLIKIEKWEAEIFENKRSLELELITVNKGITSYVQLSILEKTGRFAGDFAT
jgi:hypothetical protein